MDEELKAIGVRIKEMRKERNITQKNLAVALNISHTNMCNIENGKTAVTIQNLLKLKKIFACSISEFFVNEQSATMEPNNQEQPKLPEAIEMQDAINLLKLLRRVDIKGI